MSKRPRWERSNNSINSAGHRWGQNSLCNKIEQTATARRLGHGSTIKMTKMMMMMTMIITMDFIMNGGDDDGNGCGVHAILCILPSYHRNQSVPRVHFDADSIIRSEI